MLVSRNTSGSGAEGYGVMPEVHGAVGRFEVPVGGERRKLFGHVWGAPRGFPIFLLHGTPGSHLGPRPRTMVLNQLGVRLIAYDRPGYGRSDRLPKRSVAHAADDVAAIAKALRLNRFAVVGRSGGGPHALACAARLSADQLTSVAALVSLAPFDAQDLDWFSGMAESNKRAYNIARRANEEPLGKDYECLVEDAEARAKCPDSLVANVTDDMPRPDRLVVADAAIRTGLRRNFSFAAPDKLTNYGWIDDVLSFCKPWDFKLSDIDVPVLLWQGQQDVFSPVGHFQWLAKNIPEQYVTAVLEHDAAHFGALPILRRVLRWLRDGGAPTGGGHRAAAGPVESVMSRTDRVPC